MTLIMTLESKQPPIKIFLRKYPSFVIAKSLVPAHLSCLAYLTQSHHPTPPPHVQKRTSATLDTFGQLSLSLIKGSFSRCQGRVRVGWEAEGTEVTLPEQEHTGGAGTPPPSGLTDGE